MRSTERSEGYGSCEKHGNFLLWNIDGEGRRQWVNPGGACPMCKAEKKHQEAFARLALPARFRDCTVSNYRATNDGQRRARKVATDYCEAIKDHVMRGDSLIFVGNCGTGKTHLACAIGKCAVGAGLGVQFTTVRQMLRDVRSTWNRGALESESEAIDRYVNLDLLILDEVGVQVGSDSEMFTLFDVLGERYAQKKATIIISNLPLVRKPEEPEEKTIGDYLGERLFDRFCDDGSMAVSFNWNSYRGTQREHQE